MNNLEQLLQERELLNTEVERELKNLTLLSEWQECMVHIANG